MKVALVYDWVTTRYGGAEKVLLALHEAFPDAPLFTAVADVNQATWAQAFDIRTSWIQRIPVVNRFHRWLAPLLPLAFEAFDVSDFDVVISVTSSEAKGIMTKPHQLHICYLLTPPRYLFSHADEYQAEHLPFPGIGWLLKPIMNYLKWWDKAAAFRPDVMVAISELVKRRAWEYYGRAGIEVVYPPVAMVAAETSTNNEGFYLVISRLVAYKRIDLVIQACRQLGRPVVIVGHGPDRERLEEIAEDDPLVKFTGHVSQPELRQLLADCRAVLMPGLEDFGITACEAVAVGKPVILHHQSGAAELIQHLKQGVHLKNESSEALIDAINILETTKFQPHKLQQSMRKYVTTTFVKNWHSMVTKLWQTWQEKGVL